MNKIIIKTTIIIIIAMLMFGGGYIAAHEIAVSAAHDYTEFVIIEYCGVDYYNENKNGMMEYSTNLTDWDDKGVFK